MEGGGSRKLPESESSDETSGSMYDLFSFSDDEDSSKFSSELVEEVMQELWKEINNESSASDTVHADLISAPESSKATSSGTHALQGDNESCGPAVSDSASTIMAGVKMDGYSMFRSVETAELPEEGAEEECKGLGDDVKMED